MKLTSSYQPLLQLGIALATTAAIAAPILAHGGSGHGFQDGMGMYFDPTTVTTMSGVLRENLGDWQVQGHGKHGRWHGLRVRIGRR